MKREEISDINKPIATINLGGTFHTFDRVRDVFHFLDLYYKEDDLDHVCLISFEKEFFWAATKPTFNCEFTNATGTEIEDFNSWRILKGEIFRRKMNKTRTYHINIINAKS